MKIDNVEVSVKPGQSVLDAARAAGIEIPTLCHHEALEPFGGCRVCIVEVEERGSSCMSVESDSRSSVCPLRATSSSGGNGSGQPSLSPGS